jgi:hypothetical protein
MLLYANIPVITTLDFDSPNPKVSAMKDSSMDRTIFLKEVVLQIQFLLSDFKDTEIYVSCYCHLLLTRRLIQMFTEKERRHLRFSNSAEMLGCQFPVVVMVLDLSTCSPQPKTITDILTRTTTSLTCVINTSLKPMKIDNLPSFSSFPCTPPNLLSYFKSISQRVTKKVFVSDTEGLVPNSVRYQLDSRKFDFEWARTSDHGKRRRRTEEAGIVLEVTAPRSVSFIALDLYVPVVQVLVADDLTGVGDWDSCLDRSIRIPIHDFFKNWTTMG